MILYIFASSYRFIFLSWSHSLWPWDIHWLHMESGGRPSWKWSFSSHLVKSWSICIGKTKYDGNYIKQTGLYFECVVSNQWLQQFCLIVKIQLFVFIINTSGFQGVNPSNLDKSNKNKPWFDDNGKKVVAERKKALRQCNLRPSLGSHKI